MRMNDWLHNSMFNRETKMVTFKIAYIFYCKIYNLLVVGESLASDINSYFCTANG